MRIHSDVLTRGDFGRALIDSGMADDGVYIGDLSAHGSRSRAYAFEVRLGAAPGRDANGRARRAAAGLPGQTAATYDEWGYWIADLFRRDENAIVGPYKGAQHFDQLTRYEYC